MTDYFTEYDEVLENKLGIEDPGLLKKAEEEIVFLRLVELEHKPIQGVFDFEHLKSIHRYLFSDIYTMAGKVRTVNIAKDGSAFCYAQFIDCTQKKIFDRLHQNNFLQGISEEEFTSKLVELSGDLNALHPFRDGNGRAIRVFLSQLSENAGYRLSLENAQKEELLAADIAAFKGNLELLTALYSKLIEPI